MKPNSVVVKEINEYGSNRATCLKSFHFCKYYFYHNQFSAPSLLIWQIGFPLFAFFFFLFLLFPLRVFFLFLFGFISLFFFLVFYLIFSSSFDNHRYLGWINLLLMVPFNTLILLCIFLWKYNVRTENCTNCKGASEWILILLCIFLWKYSVHTENCTYC